MGRITPYSPMHEPRKEVSLQKMHEILARHVAKKEQLARPQVVVEPPKSPKIVWQEPVKHPDQTGYLLSEGLKVVDERITGAGWVISKSFVDKLPRYCASRILPEWRRPLGCKNTLDEAKALCEAAA